MLSAAAGSILGAMLDSVKWRIAISCPLCGLKGSAILSDSAGEPLRARRIELLSRGFLGTVMDTPPAPIFLCVECHVPAFSEPQGVLDEPHQTEASSAD